MSRDSHLLSIGLIPFILLSAFVSAYAESNRILEVGAFSSAAGGENLPSHWQPLTFQNKERHTAYELVREDGKMVVRATSDASASGLIRKITIDPQAYPWIRWRWKTTRVPEKADVTRKEGDDYAARIYITFQVDLDSLDFWEKAKYRAAKLFYGEYPPAGAISYIWASRAPSGTMVPNPYTDRVMMFVVESGKEKLNTWVAEERNIYRDYQAAFGKNPPLISGVAIMTDTDDTGESAVTYYGDIVFLRKED
jgi:hypothetical protein